MKADTGNSEIYRSQKKYQMNRAKKNGSEMKPIVTLLNHLARKFFPIALIFFLCRMRQSSSHNPV